MSTLLDGYSSSVTDNTLSIKINKNGANPLINVDTHRNINIYIDSNISSDCILRIDSSLNESNIKVNLASNSHLRLNFLRLYSNENIKTYVEVSVEGDAKFEGIVGEFAPSNASYDVLINLEKPGSEGYFRLATIAQGNEDKNIKVNIVNKINNTIGKMDNYGVVKDEAKLLIEGIGTIKKGAYGSSSNQNNRIIIFDETSNANANPYLFIDEYDVKASHACSVGQIDENQIYYLMSRGLSKDLSRRYIALGYLTPILEYFNSEELKDEVIDVLSKKVEK